MNPKQTQSSLSSTKPAKPDLSSTKPAKHFTYKNAIELVKY